MILVEIQDTKVLPSSESKMMKEATRLSVSTIPIFYMLCVCLMGYAAFGIKALDSLLTGFGFFEPFRLLDITSIAIVVHLVGAYQVFCQHMFSLVERRAAFAACLAGDDFIHREIRVGPLVTSVFHLTWRSAFVFLIATAAMLLFLFSNMVGFHGLFTECYLLHTGLGFFEPFRRTGCLHSHTHLLEESSSAKLSLVVQEETHLQENQANDVGIRGTDFANSFSNIFMETQDPIKSPTTSESKVTQNARSLSRLTRSCLPMPTKDTLKQLVRRSHRTSSLTQSGDGSLPPQKIDWFRIMGSTVLNTKGTCVISASVMCIEALYRLRHEKYHGANSCFLKVTVDVVESLKKMCEEKEFWCPIKGATVVNVLGVIHSMKQGLKTVYADLSLRLQSFESFHTSRLSPEDVTSMLRKGPMIGGLYASDEFFSSTVYGGDRDEIANHAVVCTGYRYIVTSNNQDPKLFIIVMDNVELEGPFRFVQYEAFKEFHVLTVDEC